MCSSKHCLCCAAQGYVKACPLQAHLLVQGPMLSVPSAFPRSSTFPAAPRPMIPHLLPSPSSHIQEPMLAIPSPALEPPVHLSLPTSASPALLTLPSSRLSAPFPSIHTCPSPYPLLPLTPSSAAPHLILCCPSPHPLLPLPAVPRSMNPHLLSPPSPPPRDIDMPAMFVAPSSPKYDERTSFYNVAAGARRACKAQRAHLSLCSYSTNIKCARAADNGAHGQHLAIAGGYKRKTSV